MRDYEVSKGGILAAVFLCLIATVGTFLCQGFFIDSLNWLWLSLFGISLLTLSAAIVNFDLKRIIS